MARCKKEFERANYGGLSNKIDISKIDLEREKEKITDLPGLIEYAHTVGGALIKPEDKGKIKGQAMSAMQDQTTRQFDQIFGQMKTLLDQANQLKKRVEISERIYQSEMGFSPVIGQHYHLYTRDNGTDFLSMIAPFEWGRSKKWSAYIGSVKLLSDHTWELLAEED